MINLISFVSIVLSIDCYVNIGQIVLKVIKCVNNLIPEYIVELSGYWASTAPVLTISLV